MSANAEGLVVYLKNIIILIFTILAIAVYSIYAKNTGGLIYTGIDTIHYSNQYGFDFYAEAVCSTGHPGGCFSHFNFAHLEYLHGYVLLAGDGKSIRYGRYNLDSIKVAPPDSIWAKYQAYADTIPDDSLANTIGDIFLIKSGSDPRLRSQLYAKIKILNIIFRNKAEFQVDVVFLWACQLNGGKDLGTTGLDTFHLDSIPTIARSGRLKGAISHEPGVMRIVGNTARIPAEWVGNTGHIKLFDMKGRVANLSPILINKGCIIKPKEFGEGVWFVKEY